MTAEQLRKSILQYAIEGKLVLQNPNDEPASVLLQKIQEEKQKLISDGKLKKDKNESFIYQSDDGNYYENTNGKKTNINGDILFEIPNNWEWVRLRNIINVVSAKRVLQSDWKKRGIPFYRAREIVKLSQDGSVKNDLFISNDLFDKLKAFGLPEKDDLMVTAVGTIGVVYTVKSDDKFYYKDASVLCFKNCFNLNSMYLKYLIESPYMINQIKELSAGTTVNTITIEKANDYLIPLPPLEEQKRIVEKIQQLESLIAEYDTLEKQATKLDNEIADKLKKSILQYAIEGKLVSQNADDEPASVLLERIKAEKKKQLGKKFVDNYIYKSEDGNYYENINSKETNITEEISFDIPSNWEWTRLELISKSIKDGSHNPPKNKGKGIPLLSAANVHDNCLHTDEVLRWINNEEWEYENNRTNIELNDILITIVGAIGRTAVVETKEKFALQRSVAIIKVIAINSKYLMYMIQTPKIQYKLLEMSSGTAQKGVYLNQLKSILIPIPPLEEQKRIVAKIEQLFELLK